MVRDREQASLLKQHKKLTEPLHVTVRKSHSVFFWGMNLWMSLLIVCLFSAGIFHSGLFQPVISKSHWWYPLKLIGSHLLIYTVSSPLQLGDVTVINPWDFEPIRTTRSEPRFHWWIWYMVQKCGTQGPRHLILNIKPSNFQSRQFGVISKFQTIDDPSMFIIMFMIVVIVMIIVIGHLLIMTVILVRIWYHNLRQS